MGQSVYNFVQNFQDMFIIKVNTLTSFPNNLSNLELNLINQQLEDISSKLQELSTLTRLGSEENLKEYKQIIEVLNTKLEYIEDLSDMLLYINSFYDMNNVLDIQTYNLRESVGNTNIIYDEEQKGLTLRSVSNNFSCPKEIVDGQIFVYYNTNLSYHSGIILHSEYLDVLSIKNILLIKGDGTTLRLPFTNFSKNSLYIKHDYLTSTQISVEFNVNILALPPEEQEYYKSLKLSLMDYEYLSEGYLNLQPLTYNADRTFNFINNISLPANTFLNLSLDIDLLDVNENKINTVSPLISLGSQTACKRLNNINFNTVENILGIYINNHYKENKKDKITKEYLESLENKNEIYVIYKAKIEEKDKLNNYYTVLNNQGIVFKNRNIKNIKVYPKLEFFSFNNNLSPTLKILIGITKYE